MARLEKIGIGSTIMTIYGYIKIVDIHTVGQYDCIFYEYNPETEEDEFSHECILTKYELNRYAKEYDGKNHNFTWNERE